MAEEQTVQSTADIAAEVVDDGIQDEADASADVEASPAGETPAAGTPDAGTPETPAPETHQQAVAEAISEAERLLRKHGFKDAKRDDGREFRIARSKVQKMLDELITARDEAGKPVPTLTKERDTLKAQIAELQSYVKGDPKAFLEHIAGFDPRYKSFLTPQTPPAPAGPPPDMPAPDLRLPDGQMTYSREGIEKRMAWEREQAVTTAEARIAARLKPYEEQQQQAQYAQHLEARGRQMLERAATWPHFGPVNADGSPANDVQKAIMAEMGKDPAITLYDAYLTVVGNKFTVDEQAVEAKVLARLKTAPKSTTVTAGAETPRSPKPLSTRDIAAQVVAEGEKG